MRTVLCPGTGRSQWPGLERMSGIGLHKNVKPQQMTADMASIAVSPAYCHLSCQFQTALAALPLIKSTTAVVWVVQLGPTEPAQR